MASAKDHTLPPFPILSPPANAAQPSPAKKKKKKMMMKNKKRKFHDSDGPIPRKQPTAYSGADQALALLTATPVTEEEEQKGEASMAESSKGKPVDVIKKTPFQKLWKSEDVIVILKGMVRYQRLLKECTKQTDDSLASYATEVHKLIKELLSVEVNSRQVADKIRRLKCEYFKRLEENENKKKNIFLNSHDEKVFKLSQKIWGDKSQNSDELVDEGIAGDLVRRKCIEMGMNECVVIEGLALIDGEKRAEMDDRWRKLLKEEGRLLLKQLRLVTENAKVIIDAE